MFNLYEIIRNAHGGHALDNLATQFGITAEQADAAVKAVVPVLSEGFLKQASDPHAFGSFIGALGEGQHLAAFTDPAAAQATATAQNGGDILSQILTSHSAREEIALRASSGTGISPDTLAKMLPVIASMLFGGLAKSMENQGFGGILGQLANVAGQGGLGAILGQILGGGRSPMGSGQPPSAAPGPAGGGQGGLGGILGSILGNLTNRPGAGPGPGPAAGPAAPSGNLQAPGLDTASIQAGLEALTKMLQPGTPPPTGPQQSGVSAEINEIMSGKRQ
jgi:hypothetical protein